MTSDKSELIRKKYKYRRLIMTGKIKLPHREAAQLLGPDCAYHLYSIPDQEQSVESKDSRKDRSQK